MKANPRIIQLLLITLTALTGCGDEAVIPLPFSSYELWKSKNIHNYTIEQVRSCFCVDGGQKVRITVLADSVYSVMRISDSALIAYPASKMYLTVDSLFQIIRNPKSDSLITAYDPKYGYPSKLDVNPQLHPVDGGVLYESSNLQVIK